MISREFCCASSPVAHVFRPLKASERLTRPLKHFSQQYLINIDLLTHFLLIFFSPVFCPVFRVRDELRMNVNQQPHMASPYGQPQPGYQGYPQPGYGGGHVPSGYPAQYAPYNGPGSAYQQGQPQGKGVKVQNDCEWFRKCLWQVII